MHKSVAAALVFALFSVFSRHASAATYFSLGASGASASTSLGHVAVAVNFTDQWHGTKVRILSLQAARPFSLGDGFTVSPSVNAGHDIVKNTSTDDLEAGVSVQEQISKRFGVEGGVQLGRTFRSSVPGADGVYKSGYIGVDYKLGKGYLSVDYSRTQFPATASGRWKLRGLSVGYQFAF